MLGLPSTTEVNRKMAKEDFYRHLKLTTKQRDAFVQQIDSIRIANDVKASTMRIADGQSIHEVFFMELGLKLAIEPALVIETISKANPHKIVFKASFDGESAYSVYRAGKAWFTGWLPADDKSLWLAGMPDDIDDLWRLMCSQIIFSRPDVIDVDTEIKRKQKLESLHAEIAKLERAHGREKQMGKRNALFSKLQEAKRECEALMKG